MKLVSLLADSIRSKLAPVENRMKKLTDTEQMEQNLSLKIRDKMLKSLGIRPRNPKDYYPLGWWMVSKRLAAVLIAAAGVLSLIYISTMMPENMLESRQYRTYKYNAVPLKFYKGTVKILGKSGYTAYIGEVKGGAAQGEGTLYQPNGDTVYEGAFSENMFHGKGKLFYSGGALKYEGAFKRNQYSGEGRLYRKSGILEYAGAFLEGMRQGEGELYNEAGQKIYAGAFQYGGIPYESFTGKTTAEVSEMYFGKKIIYSFENMICTFMDEIGAMYVGSREEGSLKEEWQVSGIYILNSVFRYRSQEFKTRQELEEILGAPVYEGNTAVTWTDAAALHSILEIDKSFGQPPVMETEAEFEDVVNIEAFDSSYEVYITAYVSEGYRYLFFSPEKSDEFSFYLIEPAEEGTG